MLVKLASEMNQNEEGTSVDFYLTTAETEELEQTGYVVTEEGYCFVEIDGEYQVFKLFEEWSGIQLNSRLANECKKEEN